jgi:hypothetical protein
VTFIIFCKDCLDLAKEQISGKLTIHSLPTSQKYDRIDVSNTVDDGYVGFKGIIENWGPALNRKNPSSTLFTYLMNWHISQPGSTPEDDPKSVLPLLEKAYKTIGPVM